MSWSRRSVRRTLLVLACLVSASGFVHGQAPATSAATPPPAPSAADHGGLAVVTTARSTQPGEIVLFRMTAPPDVTSVIVSAFAHTFPAYRLADGTWQALVGVDLDTRPGAHPITITALRDSQRTSRSGELTVTPKQFPTRRLKVNPALVEPPPEALERIKRESERTAGIYLTPRPFVLPDGYVRFIRPVSEPANSAFGTRSIFNGKRGSPHTGADFLSGTGTPIKAPSAGHIRLAESLYFSGNTVLLDHGLGLFSMFAHLSEFKVKEGDVVQEGEVVGLVGATGRVTGPHLHWSLRANGARVDPLSLLSLMGTSAAPTATPVPLELH